MSPLQESAAFAAQLHGLDLQMSCSPCHSTHTGLQQTALILVACSRNRLATVAKCSLPREKQTEVGGNNPSHQGQWYRLLHPNSPRLALQPWPHLKSTAPQPLPHNTGVDAIASHSPRTVLGPPRSPYVSLSVRCAVKMAAFNSSPVVDAAFFLPISLN